MKFFELFCHVFSKMALFQSYHPNFYLSHYISLLRLPNDGLQNGQFAYFDCLPNVSLPNDCSLTVPLPGKKVGIYTLDLSAAFDLLRPIILMEVHNQRFVVDYEYKRQVWRNKFISLCVAIVCQIDNFCFKLID